jgi:hypothetical protein
VVAASWMWEALSPEGPGEEVASNLAMAFQTADSVRVMELGGIEMGESVEKSGGARGCIRSSDSRMLEVREWTPSETRRCHALLQAPSPARRLISRSICSDMEVSDFSDSLGRRRAAPRRALQASFQRLAKSPWSHRSHLRLTVLARSDLPFREPRSSGRSTHFGNMERSVTL